MSDIACSVILDFVIDYCEDTFTGVLGKIKRWTLKRKLKKEISQRILKKYGDREYYNELDHFLTKNDVICSIIRDCCSHSTFNSKSRMQTTKYYVLLFVEEYPNFKQYQYEICDLIKGYFEVIFYSLNPINSESSRSICAVLSQIIGELGYSLEQIMEKLDSLNEKFDHLQSGTPDQTAFLHEDRYRNYLFALNPNYSQSSYLSRKLFLTEGKSKEEKAIDVLLEDKKILVLGEAGYGKTYECVRLLSQLLTDDRTYNYIPFFFPLQEYGTLYKSIIEGIKYKISSFIDGSSDKLIETWLIDGKSVFIFDGLDDISTDINRANFITEVTDFYAKYNKNLFFITSRGNRYHKELSSCKEYYLTKIDERTVRHVLTQEGIYVDLPQNYYELFSNPFYLEIGRTLLKKHNNSVSLFNRSELFIELFRQLYGGIEQKKGIRNSMPITSAEALEILGKFAYETYSIPAYTYLQFEQRIGRIVHNDRAGIINSFISSGLFSVADSISFSHKLIKEFCAAHYLVSNYPLLENRDLYDTIIRDEEWKEVFIFASGLFDKVADQDCFLDYVMENNLPLYVECVDAKSDLHINASPDNKSLVIRLLSVILYTYTYIINNYFAPIKNHFPLMATKNSDSKTAIRGCLSDEEMQFSYWFDLVPNEAQSVVYFESDELKARREEARQHAFSKKRSYTIHFVDLSSTGLPKDSGRKIALDEVKKSLKAIINSRELIESNYLLCERVQYTKRKIKELRDIDDLTSMQETVTELINNDIAMSMKAAGVSAENIVACEHNGVDLLKLQAKIQYLINNSIPFKQYLLPEHDIPYGQAKSGWIWAVYSKEQVIRRVADFLYFHGLSYQEMIAENFPQLIQYFSLFQDFPYQTIATVEFHEEAETQDYSTCPVVMHYNVAVDGSRLLYPKVTEGKSAFGLVENQAVFQEIQDSFIKKGRKAHTATISEATFSTFLSSTQTNTEGPLTFQVYKTIAKSLEEIFGDLD